jgi:predicted Zn-dependent protease
MGQQVAAKGVTVVDDGTMASRRGSLSIDDEGTPTNRTVLIEDGILVGYMQDRQNARLMNMKPTGNGRRQGYAHVPMPRMTNTYMLAGSRDPAEILASVKTASTPPISAAARSTSPRANTCSSAPRPTRSRTARSARRSRARC